VLSSLDEGNISDVLVGVLAERQPSAKLVERLLRVAGNLSDERALRRALDTVCTPEQGTFAVWQLAALAGFFEALQDRPRLREQLLDGPTIERIGKLIVQARTLAARADAPEDDRRLAMLLLARGPESEKEVPLLAGLLTPRHPPAVQQAALSALAQLPQASAAQRLLADWDLFSPRLRGQAVEVLLSRPAWTRLLLAHIEQGKMTAGQLDAANRQRLLEHKDPAIRAQAVKLLAGAVSPDRKKVVEEFEKALTLKGDIERGRQVFRLRCAACHQLEGQGQPVGPDLAALTDKSAKVMLLAVLDPNQAVEDRYLAYVAALLDGRSFTGVLAAETGTSVTLKGQDGKEQVLLRNQIEELRSTRRSLMPEGIEKDVTIEQMADLLAYLAGVRSAPAERER
jgi:putative heme-binding domain-containing protein